MKAGLLDTDYTREPLCSRRLQTLANSLEMPAITDSQSFVVIDKGGVSFGNESTPDISLETVHMYGGLLFKDGTAKWCGKSQDKTTQDDLDGSRYPGVFGQNPPLLQLIHDNGNSHH